MSSLVENRRHIATVLSRASFAQSTLWLNHGRETAGCLRPAPAAAEIDEIEEVAPRLGAYDGGLPAMAISNCAFPVQVPPTTIQIAFGLREGADRHVCLGQCRIQRRLSSFRFLMPLSRRHSLVPDHAYPSGSGSDLSLRQRTSGRISPEITLVILCCLALVTTVMHAHP